MNALEVESRHLRVYLHSHPHHSKSAAAVMAYRVFSFIASIIRYTSSIDYHYIQTQESKIPLPMSLRSSHHFHLQLELLLSSLQLLIT